MNWVLQSFWSSRFGLVDDEERIWSMRADDSGTYKGGLGKLMSIKPLTIVDPKWKDSDNLERNVATE